LIFHWPSRSATIAQDCAKWHHLASKPPFIIKSHPCGSLGAIPERHKKTNDWRKRAAQLKSTIKERRAIFAVNANAKRQRQRQHTNK
jgi:hypothetical protein